MIATATAPQSEALLTATDAARLLRVSPFLVG
jgi:hypothetical protein